MPEHKTVSREKIKIFFDGLRDLYEGSCLVTKGYKIFASQSKHIDNKHVKNIAFENMHTNAKQFQTEYESLKSLLENKATNIDDLISAGIKLAESKIQLEKSKDEYKKLMAPDSAQKVLNKFTLSIKHFAETFQHEMFEERKSLCERLEKLKFKVSSFDEVQHKLMKSLCANLKKFEESYLQQKIYLEELEKCISVKSDDECGCYMAELVFNEDKLKTYYRSFFDDEMKYDDVMVSPQLASSKLHTEL